ncbi:4-(cytidine 5'-diphospho)-2-C-methyl-D-erythritol kinase [Candidatus Peregrinibacteria bacterium CG10_big_fil_rev_8_21_14_0_10_36_19]|nr:MAG: 4-(cytidine 5'-diphospho)-2-C-methyl-D-erythritol kinase [Candidatus Peregrinibacteria bacterium CG10_big_fil_rev_8_21_14_0_10_36_19]
MFFSSPCKINLCLDILKKTPSGYHKIQTVIQELPQMADEIIIEETKDKDFVSTSEALKKTPIQIPENLAEKALQLFKTRYQISQNFKISILKKIPISSGLGGGSSNAATVLKALNIISKKNIPDSELELLAAELGMDVPFFIKGGTQFAENFGEKLTPLKSLNVQVELAFASNKKNSTAANYKALDLSLCGKDVSKTEALLIAIENGEKITPFLHNDFQQLYQEKEGFCLSGSGPSSFKILLCQPEPL